MAAPGERSIGRGLGLRLLTWAGVAFLLAPLVLLILFSFNASRNISQWGGFSLAWYRAAFRDASLWTCVRNSLLVATLSTALSTLLGTLAALALGRGGFRGHRFLHSALHVPILLPEIVLGVAMVILFQLIRMPLGLVSVTVAHVTLSFAFVALIVLAAVRDLDPQVEQAARDLGATPLRAFFDVVLPDISSGIAAGALFAFCLSIDDFVLTFFTTGGGFATFPMKVYAMLRFGVTPTINAVSTLLVLVTCLALGAAGLLKLHAERLRGRLKPLLIGASLLVAGGLAVLFLAAPPEPRKVVVANYSDYMDPTILEDFTRETGIRVDVEYINDGNELLTKLNTGSTDYDLLMLTDHLVGVARKLDLVQPFDHARMPNYRHVMPAFRAMPFDPTGRYYVPYTYGLTAIVYNAEKVRKPVDSWWTFWDPGLKDRTTLVDEMRQAFSIPFLLAGRSINDTDPAHLEEARQLLLRQKPQLKKYESNLIKEMLRAGTIDVAQVWTGEILRLNRENPKFRLALPREGCPLFVDTFGLRKGTPRSAEAHAFMDYLLRPDIAARNMAVICYGMPNAAGRQALPPELRDSPILWPSLDTSGRYQMYEDIGPYLATVHRAWIQVKGN